jgi:hypothetical protein
VTLKSQVAQICEACNEFTDPINSEAYLEQLSDSQLLK